MSQLLTQNSVRAGFVVNSFAMNKELSAKPAPTTQNYHDHCPQQRSIPKLSKRMSLTALAIANSL
jgi:hypothetical protein